MTRFRLSYELFLLALLFGLPIEDFDAEGGPIAPLPREILCGYPARLRLRETPRKLPHAPRASPPRRPQLRRRHAP